MANTAVLIGGKMLRMFAQRDDTIVAGSAIIDDAGVIKHCGCKGGGAMTTGTILGGGDMIR